MTTSLLCALQQQHQQLVQLNELLRLEREAFIARDAEQTQSLSQQKLAMLEQLQSTDTAIKSQFSSADFSDPQAAELKSEVEQLLATAKQENEVNGKILQTNQVTLNMLKDIVIGSRKDRNATTYDQLGQKTNTLKGRAIKA